jgi:hypothetical protein
MQYGRKTSTNIFNIGAGAKFNLPFYPGSMSRIYELRGGRYGYESSTTSDYNKEGWSYTSKFNPFISHDKISTISGEKYPLYRKKA